MSTELKETLNIASRVSAILAKQTGKMIGSHHVEEGGFELSMAGEPHAGGSYYINNGRLVLASVTPQRDLGDVNNIKEIEKNMREL